MKFLTDTRSRENIKQFWDFLHGYAFRSVSIVESLNDGRESVWMHGAEGPAVSEVVNMVWYESMVSKLC
jgi:hypothetical protein